MQYLTRFRQYALAIREKRITVYPGPLRGAPWGYILLVSTRTTPRGLVISHFIEIIVSADDLRTALIGIKKSISPLHIGYRI